MLDKPALGTGFLGVLKVVPWLDLHPCDGNLVEFAARVGFDYV